MRIPRAHVQGNPAPGALLDLTSAEGRHLVRVLRRSAGDPIRLVASDGGLLDALIETIADAADGPSVRVRVLGRAPEDPPPIVPWTIGLAVVKGESFDLAVRMAAELGLARIVPLWTERTVVRPDPGPRGSRKVERWTRIAGEAAKQCGRAVPLAIDVPRSFDAFLRACVAPRKWMAVPGAPVRLDLPGEPRGAGEPGGLPEAAFLVGPEGGFTPAEIACAAAAGFEPIGFPTPVLRTPTAVALIAALGVVLGGLAGPDGRLRA